MIEVIPAIDLIDAKCVRLTQGEYSQKKVYNKSPLDLALEIEAHGIKRLHLVDLDGAKAGQVQNLRVLEEIAQQTSLVIDFGGGVKTLETTRTVLNAGADLVTLGSLAVKNTELCKEIIAEVGSEKVILGADLKDGKVAISGWQETAALDFADLVGQYSEVEKVLCTEVSRDGMLAGVALNLYSDILKKHSDLYLIASGGVASMDDIISLDQIGVPAVVVGKAFLDGRISLEEISKYVN